jgi:hypothetical protein
MKDKGSYQQTLFSLFVFVIIFGLITFHIKLVKKEKRMEIERRKMIAETITPEEEIEEIFTCEKKTSLKDKFPSCRPEDPFIIRRSF